jgi:hypothetical protein
MPIHRAPSAGHDGPAGTSTGGADLARRDGFVAPVLWHVPIVVSGADASAGAGDHGHYRRLPVQQQRRHGQQGGEPAGMASFTATEEAAQGWAARAPAGTRDAAGGCAPASAGGPGVHPADWVLDDSDGGPVAGLRTGLDAAFLALFAAPDTACGRSTAPQPARGTGLYL